MSWPKKQVIQFDPDTDLRISWGALVLDKHLWSLSSCLVKEGARGSGPWQTCIYFTQQNFKKIIFKLYFVH